MNAGARRSILSPAGLFTFALLRRTSSRPLPALLSKSPGDTRLRTPREGIHEWSALVTIRSIDAGRRSCGTVDLCLGVDDRIGGARLGVSSRHPSRPRW